MKRMFVLFCAFVVINLHAPAVNADKLLNGYSLRVGLANKALDLEVYEAGASVYSGAATEGEYDTISLSLTSPYSFFKDTSFGYYLEYGISNFAMDRQVINGGQYEADLGTNVDGYFLYVAPVLYYNIGDNVNQVKKDAFIIGLGIGAGYLKADGNIIFTETSLENFDVDIAKFDLAFVVLLEYHHNNWFIRYQNSGPSVAAGSYDYELQDDSLTIGYSFRL